MNDSAPAAQTEAQASLDDFLGVKPQQPWKKWAVYGAIALVIVLVATLIWRSFSKDEGPQYATASVERGALTVTVSATGNIEPTNKVEVGSEQSGLITEVFVQNNDRVSKGQLLAKLDPARLQDAVLQAQAGLAAAEASVGQANATLVQSRANLARLEEVSRLSGGKVPSKTEMDSGRAEAQRATANLRAAEAQVAQARAQLSSAKFNFSRAFIYSPVTGVVLSRQVEPGQTVAASFNAPVLFVIAEDLSKMQLEVKVDEADVGQVTDGQRADFTVDAYPGRSFPAQIERVDVGANASTSSSSSSSSSSTSTSGSVVAYTAVLSVANPELILRPGMTATAEIVTSEKKNVLLVPNAALRFTPDVASSAQPGGVTSILVPRGPRRGNRAEREVGIGRGSQRTIYALGADGTPQAVLVTTGETNGTQTEVTGKDLKPGMKIITGLLASGGSGPQPQGQGRPRG